MAAWVTMAPSGESANLLTSLPSRRFQMPTQFLVTVTARELLGARLGTWQAHTPDRALVGKAQDM